MLIIASIGSIFLFLNGGGFGGLIRLLMILCATGIICAINYALAVLSTHISKVLVHISFACVALVEQREAE